jgi:hypothetical protein
MEYQSDMMTQTAQQGQVPAKSAAPQQPVANQGKGNPTQQTGAPPTQQGTPAYIPGAPQLNPATIGAQPGVGAHQIGDQYGYGVTQVDPTQFAQSITNANTGLYQQQDQAVKEQLAALGISGGADIGALANLGLQQQTTQTGQLAPTIANIDLANAGALNTEGQQSMQAKEQADIANQNAAIGTGEFNANLGQQASIFNANTENQASEFNIGNQDTINTNNANIYNQQLTNDQAMKNQDWLAELGSNTSIDTGQMEGTISADQPVFQDASAQVQMPGFNLSPASVAPSTPTQYTDYGAGAYGSYPDGTAAG